MADRLPDILLPTAPRKPSGSGGGHNATSNGGEDASPSHDDNGGAGIRSDGPHSRSPDWP